MADNQLTAAKIYKKNIRKKGHRENFKDEIHENVLTE
jgi:hypothetical protein